MIEDDKNGNGYADNIVGTTSYEAYKPEKREFSAWHKPRKQFVRCRQWEEHINRLISDNSPQDGILKYFGLPGDDLLDIRYFHETICKPNSLKL